MYAKKIIPVTEQEYLSAFLDQVIYHTKKIHRDYLSMSLRVEEESLAMEMYLSTFNMDFVRACVAAGFDDHSFTLHHSFPLVSESGDKFSVRLRKAMPFPVGFEEPAALPESHEWIMQFRSLVSRTRDIDNHALIVNLVRDLESLRYQTMSDDVLRDRAGALGVYVKNAIRDVDVERLTFASLLRDGSIV